MMKVLIQPLMVLLMPNICFTDSFESSIEQYFGCLYSHVCSNKETIYMFETHVQYVVSLKTISTNSSVKPDRYFAAQEWKGILIIHRCTEVEKS